MSFESTSTTGTVLVTYSDRTATVAMNRPEAMNAMNPEMLNDMVHALKEVRYCRPQGEWKSLLCWR